MIIAATAALALGVLVFTLLVRTRDLPEPEPVSPTHHLEERKSTIYDNLRDLQFEYRLGKLSDQDYQQTKLDLQRELAAVLAEIDAIAAEKPGAPPAKSAPPPALPIRDNAPQPTRDNAPQQSRDRKGAVSSQPGLICPHCGAKFPSPLKFCGECGKSMTAAVGK